MESDEEIPTKSKTTKKRLKSSSSISNKKRKTTTTATTTTITTTHQQQRSHEEDEKEQEEEHHQEEEVSTLPPSLPSASKTSTVALNNNMSEATPSAEFAYSAPSVSHIKDKNKRREMSARLRHIKNTERRKRKQKRVKLQEALGDKAPPPQVPRTLDNTREPDDTMVQPDDQEIKEDTATDEFADYFENKTTPKILITTSPGLHKRGRETVPFIKDLVEIIPNATFKPRRNYTLKEIVEFCKHESYTDIIVINEDHAQANTLMLCHLPNGPTALFRLTSIVLQKYIHNHAKATDHYPELILNNFNTRLGHCIGRMFSALIPQSPEFHGRRVITFHNQRDFIFFRQHRYIFDSAKKARLQEIGPRFTLKLKYLQHGTFDSQFGEYEWMPKKDLITSRRRFFV